MAEDRQTNNSFKGLFLRDGNFVEEVIDGISIEPTPFSYRRTDTSDGEEAYTVTHAGTGAKIPFGWYDCDTAKSSILTWWRQLDDEIRSVLSIVTSDAEWDAMYEQHRQQLNADLLRTLSDFSWTVKSGCLRRK